MKTAGALIGLLALAFFHAPADGSGCRTVTRGTYYAPAAVTYYAPAAQVYAVPYYSVGYNGAGELADIVRLLIEDNRAMRADLVQTLKAMQGEPIPAKAPTAHPGLVALNKCATCHDADRGKPKGDFSFMKAGTFIDQGDNLARVLDAIDPFGSKAKGGIPHMPPKGHELTDREIMAATSYLNRLPPPKESAKKAPDEK